MPELRTDWLSGRTVIVAEERAARPNEFGDASFGEVASATGHSLAKPIPLPESPSASCPFCPGQEHRTPTSVYERSDGDGRWRIRVVPNMFPAVTLPTTGVADVAVLTYQVNRAIGVHEVIVETAQHVSRTSELSVAELQEVLEVYANRLRHWRADSRLRYGLVFKNQGPRAGASLVHLHSQFIALPDVPSTVEAELHRAELYFDNEQFCPYCRLIRNERIAGERIVLERDGFIAFCPFASWQPCEVWLLPAEHQPSFETLAEPAAMDHLAGVLHDLIARVESILPDANYNLLLRTAPWIDGIEPWCHWRIELLPRVTSFAGLEIAAGIHINPLSPEHSAQHLRTA